MRITPEILHKIAQDTVANRVKTDHTLLAVYLQGSLLSETPLLGNTGDIDLFFIHTDEAAVEREFVRLTDEVHLDIAHHAHKVYRQARALRLHPWLGSAVYGCKILYDPQHFLDFTQASVRAQFHRPDNVFARARQQAEHARQIWMEFSLAPHPSSPAEAASYLRALEHAVNAIACLSGSPLTERRFLLDFPARAGAVRHPGLVPGLWGLLGAPAVEATVLRGWLPGWQAAYTALPAVGAPPRLHPCRRLYYERAISLLLESEHPLQALWPLWRTWTHAVGSLPVDKHHHTNRVHQVAWQKAGEHLGLLGAAFMERVTALDAYLDQIEEILEIWGRENGV
jgi:hypothetical protein